MNRAASYFTIALLTTLLAGAWPGAAQAQYRQEAAGKVGNGDVIRIFEGKRFDRCSAAFFDMNQNMLRIAFNKERQYALSIPQVVVRRGEPLTISVSSPGAGSYAADASANHSGRAVRPLDLQTVERMMDFRGPLIVHAASTRYQWTLGTSVQNVLIAIENCTNRATGWK